MAIKRSTFRLFIFGQLNNYRQPLITLAEFNQSRALERIKLKKRSIDGLTKRIRELHEFIETNYPPLEASALNQFGSELCDLVLQGKVRALFDMATGASESLLPFELFVEDYTINSWPWEYMYDSYRGKFLTQEFHPISRGIFALYPNIALAPLNKKVRILLIIGVLPTDLEATPETEIKWMREVFDTKLATETVQIDIKQAVPPDELAMHLQGHRYDIVHFFGHAGFDASKEEGYLKFERLNDEPYKYYATPFAQLLQGKGIRLVFLNACESGRTSRQEDPARSSIAGALLGCGIPAVIATQFSIPDVTAHYLSSMIYNGLVNGHPLVKAMQDGRGSMDFAPRSKFTDWGIPVLYTIDPDLVIFPKGRTKSSPEWAGKFNRMVKKSNTIRALGSMTAPNAPTLSVERTVSPDVKGRAKMKVALIDFDAKIAFLPDLIERVNGAQDFYHFEVSYLPLPSGAIRTDVPGEEGVSVFPQLYLPMLEEYLRTTPKDLNVDKVCCLTRCRVAGVFDNGKPFADYRYSALNSTEDVVIISTHKLREYAREAAVSYAKATLYICLSSIVASDVRYDKFIPTASDTEHPYIHQETAGCLFDECDNRDELVVGLKRMKFDHEKCRFKIKDPDHVAAIDALLALEVETDSPGA